MPRSTRRRSRLRSDKNGGATGETGGGKPHAPSLAAEAAAQRPLPTPLFGTTGETGGSEPHAPSLSADAARRQRPQRTPMFLTKTYDLVDDRALDDVISWNEDGSTFVVWRPMEFARDLLPQYFRHNNFSSFVRQLNTYGFIRKIVPDPTRWEFGNEFFQRGKKHLLWHMPRRKVAPAASGAVTLPGSPALSSDSGSSSSEDNLQAAPLSSGATSASGVTRDEKLRLRRENRRLTRELGQMKQPSNNILLPTSPLDGTILKLPGMLDKLLRQRHGYTLPKGVADEMPLIKRDLEKIITIVSSNLKDDRAMMVRSWRKEVRELSYDLEDFVDQFEHTTSVTSARSIRGREITQQRKSKKTLPWLRKKLRQRLWMANKIREFSVRAQEALERHKLYNLGAVADSASTSCIHAYSTSWSSTLYGEENDYVGISDAMENLEELLNHDNGHQKLKVVSIVGFGGIGKTTLAMELYSKLGQQFECGAFVRTSQKPDMRRIFISMLSQVRPHQPPDNWALHSLISAIRAHLQDKRYLIIVEDLCSTSAWDIIKCALPDNNCCSRVLTTTELEDLALQSCDHDPKYVYKMQPLGEDNSRKLFFSSVFGRQHECPPELREISYDIIRKCGGLPLAIVTVASILSCQKGIQDQWDYVNKAIGYSLSMNPALEGMKQVLDLSFNNLPQRLKACILYTGLYEEDIIIWKDDLVNQWIAEGFIRATEGQDKKEIARSFFDMLISGKLILPVDKNKNGEVLSCTVHHMVLNLVIRPRSKEENFVTAIHHSQASTTLADKVRRLSLQFGNAEDAMPPTNMRLTHLRTLAFLGVFKCLPSVVQFRLLQVLILHFWGDNDYISFDITGISELFRLRYLKVTSNVNLELCTQMRGLKSLETLTIDARISAVPSDIVHLLGLLHLNLPAEANMPDGIGLMTSLRTLGYFDLSNNSIENVHNLGMLTNLRDLQLTCSTVQPENLDSKMQLLLNSILGRLSNLRSLTLVPRVSSYAKSIDDAGATGMSLSGRFSSLSAPALLQSLEVSPRACIFFCTPKWIGQLHNLCVLKFGIRKIDRVDVDVLRELPALAVLSLYVQTKPAARIVIGKVGFSVLKYFKFKCCDPLLAFEESAMPNLRTLKLAFNAYNDDQQSAIPVGIEYLSDLKMLSVKIGGAGLEESHRRAAELAFRDAIRVHATCHRVSVQCVKKIVDGQQDFQQTDESCLTTVEHSPVLATHRKQKRKREIPTKETVTAVPVHDGYQWRKYGENRVNNSQFPRCYFRCAYRFERNCQATKQVDRCSNAGPPQYLVKYFNEHTCTVVAPQAGPDVQEELEDPVFLKKLEDPMFVESFFGGALSDDELPQSPTSSRGTTSSASTLGGVARGGATCAGGGAADAPTPKHSDK